MWRTKRPDASKVLDDKMASKSLGRYFAVTNNERWANFALAKKVPVEFSEEDSIEELWKRHTEATERFYEIQKEVDRKEKGFSKIPGTKKSYLDLKIEISKKIMESCHFCARRCEVNRLAGKKGYCGCGRGITISSIFPHLGEEPELVPSGTIFTSGCTMQCLHCQNWRISQQIEKGTVYKPEKLAEKVEGLRKNGCRNINLVGGEPTPWMEQWLKTFKHVTVNAPVVWNSNSYYSPETAQLLAGFTDVYLLDFKYGSDECAENISDSPGYWERCIRNHLEAKKYGELIIRVLVLPDHLECCTKPILKWIAENLGRDTRVNILFQYRPEWRAHEIQDLNRRLTAEEKERAIQLAKEYKLTNFIT
ncbi:MAG: radical SAM protein [Thermoproteota archaeon]